MFEVWLIVSKKIRTSGNSGDSRLSGSTCCVGSIQNGRDCVPVWCVCVTLNQTVKGLTKTYFAKTKFWQTTAALCAHGCLILFYASVLVGRILPSIAGCSVVLETHQPRGCLKGFVVEVDEGDGILLRRDAFEFLPDEINEVYI